MPDACGGHTFETAKNQKSGHSRCHVLVILILVCAAALGILALRTSALRDDLSSLFTSEKYRTPVTVDGVAVITQDVSYGYVEDVPVEEFLDRTRFDAYAHMPLFLKLGFAFGIFEKNTVFTVR